MREEVALCLTQWEQTHCSVLNCCEVFVLELISRVDVIIRFLHSGLLIIGFSGGSIQHIPANHLLVKNVSVLGVYLGGYLKNCPSLVEEVGVNS